MAPATLNSALLFPPAERVAAVPRDQSRTPPLEPQPPGARRSLHRPSAHSQRRKRCRIQATRANTAQQERQKLQVPPGLWPREHLPAPRPQQVPGFPGAPANGNRGAEGARCFCSVTGIAVPLKAGELCFYLRDHKGILELHPSEQGGLQTSKRSLILNTTMDLFLWNELIELNRHQDFCPNSFSTSYPAFSSGPLSPATLYIFPPTEGPRCIKMKDLPILVENKP